MKKLLSIILSALTISTVFGLQKPQTTTIKGSLKIEVDDNYIAADMNFAYMPKEEAVSEISLYLTKDVTIQNLQGEKIKSYTFNKEDMIASAASGAVCSILKGLTCCTSWKRK